MLTRATYDATLIELDELFRDLLGSLRETGHLDDTIVIPTSDHGEQPGAAETVSNARMPVAGAANRRRAQIEQA